MHSRTAQPRNARTLGTLHPAAMSQIACTDRPLLPKIRVPIRRANYHDKARIRLKRAKEIALVECGWRSTANVKKYLALLGINLDLRYTNSWVALVFDLKPQIDAAKAVVDALELPQRPRIPTCHELLQAAQLDGTVQEWQEHEEESGIFFVWKPSSPKPELVTSTWLPMYLRKLGTAA